MMLKRPRKAGLISVVLALVILSIGYALFGSVDVIFMQDGKQITRQNNVSFVSEVDIPEGEFSYTANGETKTISSDEDLKAEVLNIVVNNFINFKWQERDNIIFVEQK